MKTLDQFLMRCFPRFLRPTKFMEATSVMESSQGPENTDVARMSVQTFTFKELASASVQTFTFKELASATKNFSFKFLLDKERRRRIYKGKFKNSDKFVAIKKIDMNDSESRRRFPEELLMLSRLHHQNIITLVGYCSKEIQWLLVYEFMPLGSLENHLFGSGKTLGWNTRMKIALGVAKGLEHLHNKASPPIIHRNLKPSNILLDKDYNPKISNFQFSMFGPVGDESYVSTAVVGTCGCIDPEYAATGQLTTKADVYAFGIILLQLITGRKASDITHNIATNYDLSSWVQALVTKTHEFPRVVDPFLQGECSLRDLNQAFAIVAVCLKEKSADRPLIGDVVTALSSIILPATDSQEVVISVLSS